MRTVLLIIIGFGWIGSAEAAVLINEVAWMGSDDSANHEWIELYNSGDTTVNLDGWQLQAEVGNETKLDILLEGIQISANQYLVLERNRTDEKYIFNPPAFIYTGALVNSGARLVLKRADGSEEDVVAGGENWELIGGDNETKDTAQLTVEGWKTGVPTPGTQNTATPTVLGTETSASTEVTTNETSANTSQSTRRSGGSSQTTLSLAEQSDRLDPLAVTISYPKTVYVGHPIDFTATADGRGRAVRNSLQYTWNFGDMSTATGPAATHTYDFPGEYIVSLQAKYHEYEATDTQTVVVLPITLRMNITADGHLQIHNTSPYEVDISGYSLSTVPPQTFPEHSLMAARGTITVPNAKLGTHAEALLLKDRAGNNVSVAEPFQTTPTTASPDTILRPTPVAVKDETESVSSTAVFTTTVRNEATTVPPASQFVAQAAGSQPASPATAATQQWYLLLGALILVGITTIFVSAPKRVG